MNTVKERICMGFSVLGYLGHNLVIFVEATYFDLT